MKYLDWYQLFAFVSLMYLVIRVFRDRGRWVRRAEQRLVNIRACWAAAVGGVSHFEPGDDSDEEHKAWLAVVALRKAHDEMRVALGKSNTNLGAAGQIINRQSERIVGKK